MSSDRVDVAVVGGGISGLCAAFTALKRGRTVTLFEPHRIGGLIQSVRNDGFSLETGATTLVLTPEVESLLRELGLHEEIVEPCVPHFKQYVWHNNRAVSVPRNPGAILCSPLLPFGEKLALLSSALIGRSSSVDDESIRSFFSRLIGPTAADRILGPALRGIYGGDISELSARSVFKEFWSRMSAGSSIMSFMRGRKKRRIFLLRSGNQILTDRLAARVAERGTIITDAVSTIAAPERGRFELTQASGARQEASEVVVALPGYAVAPLIPSFAPNFSKKLGELRYAPLVVTHWSIPASSSLPDRGFGVLFPAESSSSLLGIMFNTVLFPHMAPEGRHLITVSFGGAHRDEIIGLADDEIRAMASAAIAEKLGVHEASCLSLVRWKRAIPQYAVGHYRLDQQRELVERQFPGIRFIGAEFGGVGVPDRMAQGLREREG